MTTSQSNAINILPSHEDPSWSQRRAADPARHVWVRASAGSGKTTVLVKRVLRLMLPDPQTGRSGTLPERILCITFTKAGATNMAIRVQDTLMKWATCDEQDLINDLTDIFGTKDFHSSVLTSARQLFALILDRPDRLRMMTIHSFCQSVLARFPFEAGLSPSMSVLDDATAGHMRKLAFDHAVQAISKDQSPYVQYLYSQTTFSSLKRYVSTLMSSASFDELMRSYRNDIKNIITAYENQFSLSDEEILHPENLLVALNDSEIKQWTYLASEYQKKGKTVAQKLAEQIYTILNMSEQDRLAHIDEMIDCIKGKPRDKIFEDDVHVHAIQNLFLEKLQRYQLTSEIKMTIGLIEVGLAAYHHYQYLKNVQNVVDYDDLILRTQNLLSSDMSWVHYKLDGGIDHILLDESQDTTPAQWRIIQKLSEDMFALSPELAKERPRSLFVVGDEKQSIFSFQGADPHIFHDMLSYFKTKTKPYQDNLEESLRHSFRSTKPVLDLVDKTFESDHISSALVGSESQEAITHFSYRHLHKNDMAGSIELWLETDDAPEAKDKSSLFEPWARIFHDPTVGAQINQNAEYRMLTKIVNRIEREIQSGHWRPQDIMILYRSRNNQMNNLIKMLKWRNLPVSGIDRLVLNQHIVIRDLLAFAQFITLNHDDFSLACFLKSPFIGWDEDQLYECASAREDGQNLWEYIQNHPTYNHETKWIKQCLETAQNAPVYEWVSSILINPCPADPEGSGYRACVARFGHEIMDPLDEMLSDTLRLEMQDIRTLPDFISYFGGGAREIKRELSKVGHEIRVMTVHASKGLEAPVVIIPDTMSVPDLKKTPSILWIADQQKRDYHHISLPLVSPFDSKNQSELYGAARTEALNRILDEEKRLLYVALTRAEDSLIVCGAHKASDKYPMPRDESWHHLVSRGFDRLNILSDDHGNRQYGQSYSYIRKAEKEANTTHKVTKPCKVEAKIDEDHMPSWVTTPIDPSSVMVQSSNRIVNPSTLFQSMVESDDALKDAPLGFLSVPDGRNRFLRGNITHKLLQILPTTDPDMWEQVAQTYVARHRFGLSDDIQKDIVKETINVLKHPEFHQVFAQGSQAEVPILGRLSSGEIVSGQIDRLYVGHDYILVVDYKTNRPSPDDPRHIPDAYRHQLGLYRQLLVDIYPDKIIKTALLWTDRPLFMPL